MNELQPAVPANLPGRHRGWRSSQALRREHRALRDAGVTDVVYRHYDGRGQLLYVGVTSAYSKARAQDHVGVARWWKFVKRTERELITGDRVAAEDREKKVIRTESPIFNRDFNGPRLAQVAREQAYVREAEPQ